MFVGVGASRVRDLFQQAKEHSPAIIFVDEIDAGTPASAGLGGGHDEREQRSIRSSAKWTALRLPIRSSCWRRPIALTS